MVRISIREQLGLLVLFCSLLALMVLALATWFQNRSFVISIRLSSLSLTASLKATQLASTLLLYDSQTRSASTRVLIQNALQRYDNGNLSDSNWTNTISDLESALGTGNMLVQASLFPPISRDGSSGMYSLVNVTSANVAGTIALPYTYLNGSTVYLGDAGLGYPPDLYPNLTYNANASDPQSAVLFDGVPLNPQSVVFLGPMLINNSFALMSATTGVINSSNASSVLGWLTTIIDASMLFDIRDSQDGLGDSGEALIVGPARRSNQFPKEPYDETSEELSDQRIRFVLPPIANASISSRHSQRLNPSDWTSSFTISAYPAVADAWTHDNNDINNAGALISTHNEQNTRVSVGYARLSTPLVDWILLIERDYSDVMSPVNHLRDVMLICVFCTMAGLILFAIPLAHYSITPIRQLRLATSKSIESYQTDDSASTYTESSHMPYNEHEDDKLDTILMRKEGWRGRFWKGKDSSVQSQVQSRPTSSTRRRRTFKIPGKVPDRKHWVTDELTELTSTFNEMSDELTMQYQRLEERVRERTLELEKSKLEAEEANKSKTLFIANISHELKTPLNGILGLTTVCMNEDDPSRIRSTLNTIYKSGDLLLHLLTDLLTFSKNEVGQQMSIEESEFRLRDLSLQLMPTFEKQAKEGRINLKVQYLGSSDAFGNTEATVFDTAYGPTGTGRVKDMCLWGDKNRILQVLMNFVSNSLKFTPPEGSVTVRIKCLGIVEEQPQKPESARKSSMKSQISRSSSFKKKVRTSDAPPTILQDGMMPVGAPSNAEEPRLSINVAGGTAHVAKVVERQRSKSPPPLNTKILDFEFEVEDTGPGIPVDQQKKIFEPFVQGDLGLSRKYGGTGLGLSICVQLASLMGGRISLESQVGSGSKFTMRLPLRYTSVRTASTVSSRQPDSTSGSVVGNDEDSDVLMTPTSVRGSAEIPRIVGFTQPYVANEIKQESPTEKLKAMKRAEHEAVKAGRKVRVLVAEDNKINQEVVLRMLKLEDIYDVTIAKDGQEAFERVRDSMQSGPRFHLIFMDVQMPNVDGIQSTKLIRSMGFSAPIVALTAFAEKSNEDECMASGMDYFLAKPIKRPALKHVLNKYCATIMEEDGETSVDTLRPDTPADMTSDGTKPYSIENIVSVDSANTSPMS